MQSKNSLGYLELLKQLCDEEVLENGYYLYKNKQFKFIHKGKPLYVVSNINLPWPIEITILPDNVMAECSCLHDDQSPCIHVWGALLFLESNGIKFPSLKNNTEIFYNDEKIHFDLSELINEFESPDIPEPIRILGKSILNSTEELSLANLNTKNSNWRTLLNPSHNFLSSSHEKVNIDNPQNLIYTITVPIGYTPGYKLIIQRPKLSTKSTNSTLVQAQFNDSYVQQLPESTDKTILSFLLGINNGSYNFQYFNLNRYHQDILFPLCSSTNRFYFKDHKNKSHGPLTYDSNVNFYLEAKLTLTNTINAKLHFQLTDGNKTINTENILFYAQSNWLILSDKIIKLDLKQNPYFIRKFLDGEVINIRLSQLPHFVKEYLQAPNTPPLIIPPELQIQNRHISLKPLIRIHGPDEYNQGYMSCEIYFKNNNIHLSLDECLRPMYDPVSNEILEFDQKLINECINMLPSVGITKNLKARYNYENLFHFKEKQYFSIVKELIDKNWLIEGKGVDFKKAGDFSFSISSGLDWFDLEGQVSYGDDIEVDLPEILQAIRNGKEYVEIGKGVYGLLPDEWLKKYGKILSMGTISKDGERLQFKKSQALFLDLLLQEKGTVNCDSTFEKIKDELRSFSSIVPLTPPNSFQGELRNYQQEGLGWLYFLQKFGLGGCLADDMGLGKTIQVLALLDKEKKQVKKLKPSLVIAPRSLIHNWKNEAQKFTPKLKILDFSHFERSLDDINSNVDLVLVTYGILTRDINKLKEIDFHYVILDEAQNIKNASTLSSKAVRLLQANYRLALSGTPIENRLHDLWSIFDFLNPGMLGAVSIFQNAKKGGAFDNETIDQLRQGLRPFILRRTKSQVAKDLPEKTEEILYCQMEPAQESLYNELKEYYRKSLLSKVAKDGLAKSKIHILEALLRLRQVACHPGLVDKAKLDEPSVKLDTLLASIEEIQEEGHKCLVFSQFTSFLSIITKALDSRGFTYEYLDGKTKDREARVNRFQTDPDCKIFCISLKAGGVGLNLTAAEYVFILDPWWNPAVEAQAIDRTHRIGQKNPVIAYRLICEKTVEEKVLELQNSKRHLADSIISTDESVLGSITTRDLEMLLS